jgi:glycosyltransferase involved in cell wall biosynthesis
MTTHSSRPVLVVSQLPPPIHGSTVMTQRFLETLDDLGFDYRLVDRRFSKSIDEVGGFNGGKIVAAVSLALRLTKAALRRNQVCVFFTTNRTHSFLVDYVLTLILTLMRVPRISYVHTQGYSELAARGRLWSHMVQRILGKSSAVVVLSEMLAADVAPWTGNRPIVCIPNTPAEAAPLEQAPSGSEELSILFLSNLIPSKGVLDFIAICAGLSAASPDTEFRFNIVGPLPDPDFSIAIDAAIASTPRPTQFNLVGAAYGADKWNLLSAAYLLVFPSRYPFEAQPLTIIEALSVGIPTVAYSTGGIPAMIQHGVDGFLVTDVPGAVEAILPLLTNPEQRNHLASNARDAFNSHYSKDAYSAAWSNLLLEASGTG